MAVVLVFANRKGGSGKTTTAVNVADGLALQGKRTLLVDADSQAQATISSGILPYHLSTSIYEIIHLYIKHKGGKSWNREAVLSGIVRGKKRYDLLPSKADLSALELELAEMPGRESLLHDLLVEVDAEYDFILLDLPPSLGVLTINSLVAAEWLIIPLEPTFLSMDGLAQMMSILYRVNAELNPRLKLMGILPVKCDLRTNLARSVVDEIRRNFGAERLLPPVRNDVKLAEAPSFGKTVFEYSPACRGARDYEEVVAAILARSGEQS